MSALQIVLSLLAALVAVLLIVHIIRDEQMANPAFFGLVALEAGLLVQLVWGLVRVLGDHDGVAVAPYLGYLVGAAAILPIAFVWSASEKSRSGTAVVLVAVMVLPVLFLRLHDLWATGA